MFAENLDISSNHAGLGMTGEKQVEEQKLSWKKSAAYALKASNGLVFLTALLIRFWIVILAL